MTFADLDHMTMRDYVAQQAKTGGLWIFQHIPKTAGTSLTTDLAEHMSPYFNIFVDYEDETTPFIARLSDSVDRFLGKLRHRDFRSCSGHLTFDLVARIQLARPDARVVTYLRNPVDRVISDYRYQCSELHPGNAAFRESFPTIEAYVDHKASQDKMSQMLYGGPCPSAEALIAHVGSRFAFVGLVEMHAMSFSCMFAAMGLPGMVPQVHARKTPDTRETRVEVTPELRERIAGLNRMDQAIYDHVHRVLLRQRDNWWKGTEPAGLPGR